MCIYMYVYIYNIYIYTHIYSIYICMYIYSIYLQYWHIKASQQNINTDPAPEPRICDGSTERFSAGTNQCSFRPSRRMFPQRRSGAAINATKNGWRMVVLWEFQHLMVIFMLNMVEFVMGFWLIS